MEKTDEKYAAEFLAITQHIHVTIKRLLEAGNYEQAMSLLEQCQGNALSFGQQIESAEGANAASIAFLEEYCELVYQIYEKLFHLLPVEPNYIHNLLAMQLIRIGNSMKADSQEREA